MSYRDRLRSAKVSSQEEPSVAGECCEEPAIESKDGDVVCLNCGMIQSRMDADEMAPAGRRPMERDFKMRLRDSLSRPIR